MLRYGHKQCLTTALLNQKSKPFVLLENFQFSSVQFSLFRQIPSFYLGCSPRHLTTRLLSVCGPLWHPVVQGTKPFASDQRELADPLAVLPLNMQIWNLDSISRAPCRVDYTSYMWAACNAFMVQAHLPYSPDMDLSGCNFLPGPVYHICLPSHSHRKPIAPSVQTFLWDRDTSRGCHFPPTNYAIPCTRWLRHALLHTTMLPYLPNSPAYTPYPAHPSLAIPW